MYIEETDLDEIREDCGNPTFIWNNEEYDCSAAPGSESAIISIGGVERIADIVFQCNVSVFNGVVMPAYGKILIHKGKSYRIERVSKETTDTLVKFICVSDTKVGVR